MKQNITISLDRELIQKAKVVSAERNTSISRMLGQELERIVNSAERYKIAKRRALSNLRKGYHLGGTIAASREDLHKR